MLKFIPNLGQHFYMDAKVHTLWDTHHTVGVVFNRKKSSHGYGMGSTWTGVVRGRDRADESFIDGRLKRDQRRERTKQARIFSLTASATATEIILGSDRFYGELRLCRQWNRKVGDFWKRRGARSLRILAGCKKNKD